MQLRAAQLRGHANLNWNTLVRSPGRRAAAGPTPNRNIAEHQSDDTEFGPGTKRQSQDPITCDTFCPPTHPQTQDTVTCDALDVLQYKVSHVTWSWASWLWGGRKNVSHVTVSSEQDANPRAPKHVPPFALPQPQGQDTVTCDTLHVLQYKVSHVRWRRQSQDPVTCAPFCPPPTQTQVTVTCDTLDVLQYKVSHVTWSWAWCGGGKVSHGTASWM